MPVLNRTGLIAGDLDHEDTQWGGQGGEEVEVQFADFCEGVEFEEKIVLLDLLLPFHRVLTLDCYLRPPLSPRRIHDPLDPHPGPPGNLHHRPHRPHLRPQDPPSDGHDPRDPDALYRDLHLRHAFCEPAYREA